MFNLGTRSELRGPDRYAHLTLSGVEFKVAAFSSADRTRRHRAPSGCLGSKLINVMSRCGKAGK
jgi:hypothetical protein